MSLRGADFLFACENEEFVKLCVLFESVFAGRTYSFALRFSVCDGGGSGEVFFYFSNPASAASTAARVFSLAGASGSRTSSEQSERRDIAYLTGTGFVSAKRA